MSCRYIQLGILQIENLYRKSACLAGLSSKVVVVEGKFNEHLDIAKQLLEEMNAPYFDFVFLDHWKECYMPDYLLLKENGMLGISSGICADNTGAMGGPADFRKYVKMHPEELETCEYKNNVEYQRHCLFLKLSTQY
ncbi:hypothetical protein SUGI_0673910 [Cryptomeria japonica]|uniref:uncharacterized protein LOC131046491 n=1 Tax=Cryptomeria japonica TaxID=3369 RepID=UPI0024149AC4|nr:uncharacterized protein LOC131046491 [Cryptomeria japonica]GLJ33504.1 hypothetical protein SUGI_0673910 [Cryptomeria japonica]